MQFNTYFKKSKLVADRTSAGNSTFAIGGVSCSIDSIVVAKRFVLHIKIIGKKPAHCKSAKRYSRCYHKSTIFSDTQCNYKKSTI